MDPSLLATLRGTAASPLGLAAAPDQDPRVVARAFQGGINYFFVYSPGHRAFVEALVPLVRDHREDVIVATGSGSRTQRGLSAVRRKALAALGLAAMDVFFAEYVSPADDPRKVFGRGGALDELQRWKADGWIRFVGATAHDRPLAKRLAADPRVDVLMHRFNMAHRKAAREVFPTAVGAGTPVVAFTATRWGTLLAPPADRRRRPPTAADCYRYCLGHPAVRIVLSAPKSIHQLEANLPVLASARMDARERRHWERYGDDVHQKQRDSFETHWP